MNAKLSNDFVDYEFPNEIKLNFKMKDLLEPVVDEKYYINSPKSKELIEKLIVENKITTEETVDLCLKNPKKIEVAIRLGNIYNENAGAGFAGNVWDKNGISPTLTTMQGGGREPMIIDETKYNLVLEEKNGFYEQAIKTAEENNAQEGDIIDAFNQKVLKDGISPTITTRPEGKKTAILPVVKNNKIEKVGQISSEGSQCGTVVSDNGLYPTISAGCHGYANPHVWNNYRIRKLTPRECWRLMGFTDADYEAAEKVNSNTQLYKQAGNSIVKNVLMAIFNELINPSLMD